jgi:endonuclease/exonuclease/phosphatase family metal-dependent hydrolase
VILISVALMPALAMASTAVFVTNNTPKLLEFNITSTLPGEYWSAKQRFVPAFSRRKILETNRDTGVTNGETFFFTAEVLARECPSCAVIPQQSQNFAIRLRLYGEPSPFGSHMWQSVRKQSGAHDSWHDDRQKYASLMTIQGRPWYVTYWAYFTGGFDDVEYVLREDYPPPVGYGTTLPYEWQASHLNVLSYNIYMRPTSLFMNGQMIRAELIPDQIPGYDAVVFQEAFDDDARAELLRGMTAKGYPYHTDILGTDRGTEQDGGVIIVSRWPIVLQKQRLFGDVCSDWDCSADKGVLYAKIDKQIKAGEHNYFHIFGTHLNDGNFPIQQRQLEMIASFIQAQNIPATEAVIVAGDFNINRGTPYYEAMLQILDAGWFSGSDLRGHPFTHDGPLNDLGEGSQSNYDYVLYSKGHRAITPASFAEVRVPRAPMEWKELPHEKAMWDLSDHYAVYASLHFVWDPLAGWDPGAGQAGEGVDYLCNQDSDCPSGLICMEGAQPRPGARLVSPADRQPGRSAPGMAPRAPMSAVPPGRSAVPVSPPTEPSAARPGSARVDASRIAAERLPVAPLVPERIADRYKGICRVEPPR